MFCALTIIINLTPAWTTFDKQTLEHAKVRCGQLYPDAPCARVFTKKAELTYTVACGEQK